MINLMKDKNTIEFFNYLNSKKNICIVCKGLLDGPIPQNYDIYIGIKQSITILPQKDVLVMNDLEGIFGLENDFKNIKYIILPNKPHCKYNPSSEARDKVFAYLKHFGFKGKVILFELFTNKKPNKNLFIPGKVVNSAEVILEFLNNCQNKNKFNIDVYGWYSSLEDNQEITRKIVFAEVPASFRPEFLSYMSRTYKDKLKHNDKIWKYYLSHYQLNKGTHQENLQNLRKQIIDKNNKLKITFKTKIF